MELQIKSLKDRIWFLMVKLVKLFELV